MTSVILDLNYIDDKFLKNSNEPWFCISCCSKIFPFNTVKNKNFISDCCDSKKSKNIVDKDSSFLLKPSEDLKHLVNQFNICHHHLMMLTLMTLKILLHLNTASSNINELQNLKVTNKSNSLSFFQRNACSLSKNFDDLQDLLSCTNKNFDIVTITETRTTKNLSITNNLNVKNYSIEFTPTESSAGGSLLYIAN